MRRDKTFVSTLWKYIYFFADIWLFSMVWLRIADLPVLVSFGRLLIWGVKARINTPRLPGHVLIFISFNIRVEQIRRSELAKRKNV